MTCLRFERVVIRVYVSDENARSKYEREEKMIVEKE